MSGTDRKISSSEQIFRMAGVISELFRYSKIVQTCLCFKGAEKRAGGAGNGRSPGTGERADSRGPHRYA
jgi:hypothetical protein